MDIRFAESIDLNRIAELYLRNHKTTYKDLLSPDYINRLDYDYGIGKWSAEFSDPKTVIWVACDGHEFLGFVSATPDYKENDTIYLESLHIIENARGKGIGTALIRTVAEYAKKNGYKRMSINIVKGNDRAGDLYRKLGARHTSYFEDDFSGTISFSERLIWDNLDCF